MIFVSPPGCQKVDVPASNLASGGAALAMTRSTCLSVIVRDEPEAGLNRQAFGGRRHGQPPRKAGSELDRHGSNTSGRRAKPDHALRYHLVWPFRRSPGCWPWSRRLAGVGPQCLECSAHGLGTYWPANSRRRRLRARCQCLARLHPGQRCAQALVWQSVRAGVASLTLRAKFSFKSQQLADSQSLRYAVWASAC